MNLVVATIPEEPSELAGWLERRLVGLELDVLVAELSAIHPPPEARLSLRQVVGGQLERVNKSGLSCLSRGQLKLLLTDPRLLLDLQEEVLTNGESYWDQIARTIPRMHLKVEEGRKRLPVAQEPVQPRPVLAETTLLPAMPAPTPARTAWYRQPWLVSLATAAVVLLAVGVWMWARPEPTRAVAWGWQRPGAVKPDETPSAYLNALADAANEWFNKKPDDAQGLAQRIGEMRQGCSRLILAKHEPLSPKAREELVKRCRTWAEKFDRALTRLEAGGDVAEVRKEMDDTVKKLVAKLREQAGQV